MKKRNLLFLITCFVGLCTYLFIIFYNEAEKTAIRQLNEEQAILAKQAARGIEDFFATWTGILKSFSKMDTMISIDADGKRYMALFYEAHHEQIRSITRADERGRILHTVPYGLSIGSDISGQKHMREILRDHKPVVSDVFKTVQGFYAVALHVPVFKGASFKGTIAIVIDFENLAKRYLEVIKIGKTGYAWVVSRDGTTLYSPVPGFTGKSVFDTYQDYPTIMTMVKDMLQGHQGTATYTFDRIGDQTVAPVRKYAVYMPIHIANSFWSIAVASSENEVLSSLASFRNRLILVIGILLFGGVLFSIISAKAWLIVAEEEKRKRAEEELRASENRYRDLYEKNPLMLFTVDTAGTVLSVNKRGAGQLGYPVEELVGKSVLTVFYEEDKKAALDHLAECVKHPDQIYHWELRKVRKDGGTIWVQESSYTMRDAGGNLLVLIVCEDITMRKQAETALRYSEHKFMKAFHATPDAIIISRATDGLLLEVNEVFLRIAGYSHDEVVSKTTVDLGLWANPADRERYVAAVREQGKVRDREAQFRTRSGDILDGLVSGENILLGDDLCLLTIIRDITERKKTEQELEKHREHLEDMVKQRTVELQDSQRALMGLVEDLEEKKKALEDANARLKDLDRLKSLFIASMSHELRTPLNSVIGFSSILLNEWAGPLNDEQKDNLATVLRSGKHLLSLINDVIDVSKIEAGTIDVRPENFDLHDVLAEVATHFTKDADDKGLEFIVENLHQPMHTDRRRLLQCVMNLVSNGVKFTERGSVRVQARLSAEGGVWKAELKEAKHPELRTPDSELNNNFDYIEIIVEDTGIGIKQEDLPKLFHSFVRLDSPLRATVLGTGLGLYLTKKLATEALGGEIFVESEFGKGSRFGIILPVEDRDR